MIAALALTAAVAFAGFYIAYSTAHPSTAASATTVAPTTTAGSLASTTTAAPTTAVPPSTTPTSQAACTSQALLPLLKRRLDNPSSELIIVRADVKRCRSGYAHVFAIPGQNPPGHPQYDAEQLFLRDVNGSRQSVAEGQGIACGDGDITPALLRACRALNYPTNPTHPAPTPRRGSPTRHRRPGACSRRGRQVSGSAHSRLPRPTAVRALFAISPSPRPRFTGCRSRSLGFDCFYSYSDADGVFFIDMRVEGGASAGFRVVSIDAPLRFASPNSSARHLVDAWLAGDRAEARKAASATAVDAMFSLRDRRRPPSFTGCTYRSFGFDCAYTVEGGALTLRVTGGASVGWRVLAVTSVAIDVAR